MLPADMKAEISSDGACLGLRWVGVSHHCTRRLDHLVTFPHLHINRTLTKSAYSGLADISGFTPEIQCIFKSMIAFIFEKTTYSGIVEIRATSP